MFNWTNPWLYFGWPLVDLSERVLDAMMLMHPVSRKSMPQGQKVAYMFMLGSSGGGLILSLILYGVGIHFAFWGVVVLYGIGIGISHAVHTLHSHVTTLMIIRQVLLWIVVVHSIGLLL